MRPGDLRALFYLLLFCGGAGVVALSFKPRPKLRLRNDLPVADQDVLYGKKPLGTDDAVIRFTTDGSDPTGDSPLWPGSLPPSDDARIQRLIATPTSIQWRHPSGAFPQVEVVKAAVFDTEGRRGPVSCTTTVPSFGALPVVSLVLPAGALFDPDSGIYVTGNAMFRTQEEAVRRFPDDQKWWKYPGNYSLRGKRWARSADLAFFDSAGTEVFHSPVELRINGNNTRGFAQHALRVSFPEKAAYPFFGKAHGDHHRWILLRSSGNDQDRVFFRDQFQHALCEGMPFETAAGDQCVVFINGAYWGIHNLRERLDEQELARRYHIKPKKVTILADRLELYRGSKKDLQRFSRLLTMSGKWAPTALPDSLNRYMDLNGYLHYMAAQIILCNSDWPDQNGKWWRYTGDADTAKKCLDGRWYWIMGDSDLSFGLATGPDYDMLKHVQVRSSPLARLFNNCMRSEALRTRFRAIVLAQLDGPLSAERMVRMAEAQRDRIQAEMPRHIRRWRRPLTVGAWQEHVSTLLTFARQRGEHVRRQLDEHFPR